MTLRNMQINFKESMLQSIALLDEGDAEFLGDFIEDHIPVSARLKVYHNNVVGSLCEALRATFPLCDNLVGEEFFTAMARSFIFKNPPSSACLHHYGAGFDAFIANYEPAQTLPYLPDVVRFEIALNNAYYARDDAPMPEDALTSIAQEELSECILSLRSSVTVISSQYPLIQIRDFCMDSESVKAPDLTTPQETYVMISRPQREVLITPLNADEFYMLDLLHRGAALGQSVEGTLSTHANFDFALFLQKHISLETFCAVTANSSI